jgi:heme/copper-type cytochrome/quinol oxidase subunit 2
MNKIKVLSTIATFISIAAFIFAVISGISTYFILQITYSSGAPMDYIAFNTLSTMLPYLAVGVFAIITAVMTKGLVDEEPEKEEETPPPTEETTEDSA